MLAALYNVFVDAWSDRSLACSLAALSHLLARSRALSLSLSLSRSFSLSLSFSFSLSLSWALCQTLLLEVETLSCRNAAEQLSPLKESSDLGCPSVAILAQVV